MAIKSIRITSGTTFTIPSDFGSIVSVEAIGGGAGSLQASPAGGGGGGAYAKSTSVTGLTAGGTAYVSIGAGGTSGTTAGNGGDTWFNAASNAAPTLTSQGVLAKGGTAATSGTGGAGGSSASCIGNTVFSGGNGGTGTTTGKGGGGGAAGPGGVGGNGGDGAGTSGITSGGGGGGGGASLTAAGSNGANGVSGSNGGAGGNDGTGSGSGAGGTSGSAAVAGTGGGGGGGSYGNSTNNGAAGGGTSAIWSTTTGTAGPGGGSGGSTTTSTGVSGNGGTYGGGAGGSGSITGGGTGGQGVIIFTYTTSSQIAFVNAGAVATGANPTVAVPAGYQLNDLLVMTVTIASAFGAATPSGWSAVQTNGPSSVATYIFYKFASASESSVTLSANHSSCKAVMVAYRGVSSIQVFSTGTSTQISATLATNSLTTSFANEYVVSVWQSYITSSTWTAPASTTTRVSSNPNGTNGGVLIVDELQAVAGASTSRTGTLSVSNNVWTAISFALIPSGTRYWVGGSGTWNTTSTTNWSDSSGGASGAPVPSPRDPVVFDQAASYTVTCTGALNCLDITVSAGTVTFANGTSPSFSIYGSMTLRAGTIWSTTAAVNFNATTAGNTITTNGVTISGGIGFSGIGGSWSLGSALTSSLNITCFSGTLDTNASYSITSPSLTISGGTINLNTSSVTLTGTAPFTYTSGTFNAGGSIILLNNITSVAFAGGGQTFSTVIFPNTTGSIAISGANTFVSLTFNRATTGITPVTFSANQTITSDINFNGGNAISRLFLKSDVFGTTRTLNISTVIAILDTDFQDIAITGTAAPISGTRLGDCKGNSGITFPAPKTVYWGLNVTGNWNGTVWATTNGGAVNVNNFPLAQDTAVIPSGFPNSGQTVTINANYNIGTIDMSARTSNTMTLGTGTITPTIYGNWINGTGTTITGTGQIQFSGRGAQSITSAGKTFTQPFQFDSPSGTITLQDAFTTSATTSGAIKQNNGTIDLNGKTLTVSNTGAVTAWQTGTGTKNITFNGGTIVLAASGTTVFNNATPTGFTTTAGTGTGTISLTSAFAKTFVGGGSTFNCTLNQGGAGALTITGNNTFKDITNTYASTGATTITFTNVTTTTVSAFSAAGQATRLLTLNNATVAGTTAVIALSGGGTVATDYLNVQDMSFTPFATNGTAPYKWYAGANSTNSGNNSGILFAAATVTAYLLASGTSWTVPADWNNSNNTIHMIGGGGGGSSGSASGNNRAGGAGGGGGGYTAVNNFSTSPGASIAYQIGSGGITGNDGGNTTWNSGAYTAGGGKKGTQSTAPLSTGGAGGTGTYAGGDGGAGAYGTAASTGYGGGGGGGAGGPNGKGGNGGLGVSTTSNATLAGGGGGGNGGGSNGGNASSGAGGNGGNNFNGTGGGVGTVGSFGGGGAGAVNGSTGLRGGLGIDILNTVGGGGGAGGSGYSTGGSSFSISAYGSGGGASGVNITGGFGTGGNGAQGMIFIIYTPDAGGGFSVGTANFFAFF